MARKRKPVQDWKMEEFGDVPAVEAALALLLSLYRQAEEEAESPWRFAVRLTTLLRTGLTKVGARRLVERGVLDQHGKDLTLTEDGAKWAQRLNLPQGPFAPQSAEPVPREVPVYNSTLRELRYKGKRVRRIRKGAVNLERILEVFEEEGWPPSIQDPLSGPPEGREDRLHNALTRLNDKQTGEVRIVFHRTGSIIYWEVQE
jgi:hypothetical protein